VWVSLGGELDNTLSVCFKADNLSKYNKPVKGLHTPARSLLLLFYTKTIKLVKNHL